MPIFFSLFSVLNDAQHEKAGGGVGLLNENLAKSFGESDLFGAPLKATLANNEGSFLVIVFAVTMIALMTASQFITQLQIMSKNQSPEAKNSPMFPLGVMFYWLTSNFWTMGQQFLVIRNMPTPGSEAAAAREARLAKRGKLVVKDGPLSDEIVRDEIPKTTQRQQPVNKNRAKKQGGSK
jgi:YidC/Oxa1 family membrane protein insertase